MGRVEELEQLVMTYVKTNAPQWTGNLFRHITAFGKGHIRISGPAYDKEVARALVNKRGKGNVRRLSYSTKQEIVNTPKAVGYIKSRITVGKQGDLFDYAFLLNEAGAFGTGRHKHWVNSAVYTACVMYCAANLGGHVKFGGGFQPY